MPGIRVTHPDPKKRNARYVVVDSSVPYPEPYTCTPPEFGGCGSTHNFKTHHLNLDETGSVIVSQGVFDRIKERLALDGFVIGNEVKKPPALGIGMGMGEGQWGNIPIIRSPNSKEPI
jgi:hypothetical protein